MQDQVASVLEASLSVGATWLQAKEAEWKAWVQARRRELAVNPKSSSRSLQAANTSRDPSDEVSKSSAASAAVPSKRPPGLPPRPVRGRGTRNAKTAAEPKPEVASDKFPVEEAKGLKEESQNVTEKVSESATAAVRRGQGGRRAGQSDGEGQGKDVSAENTIEATPASSTRRAGRVSRSAAPETQPDSQEAAGSGPAQDEAKVAEKGGETEGQGPDAGGAAEAGRGGRGRSAKAKKEQVQQEAAGDVDKENEEEAAEPKARSSRAKAAASSKGVLSEKNAADEGQRAGTNAAREEHDADEEVAPSTLPLVKKSTRAQRGSAVKPAVAAREAGEEEKHAEPIAAEAEAAPEAAPEKKRPTRTQRSPAVKAKTAQDEAEETGEPEASSNGTEAAAEANLGVKRGSRGQRGSAVKAAVGVKDEVEEEAKSEPPVAATPLGPGTQRRSSRAKAGQVTPMATPLLAAAPPTAVGGPSARVSRKRASSVRELSTPVIEPPPVAALEAATPAMAVFGLNLAPGPDMGTESVAPAHIGASAAGAGRRARKGETPGVDVGAEADVSALKATIKRPIRRATRATRGSAAAAASAAKEPPAGIEGSCIKTQGAGATEGLVHALTQTPAALQSVRRAGRVRFGEASLATPVVGPSGQRDAGSQGGNGEDVGLYQSVRRSSRKAQAVPGNQETPLIGGQPLRSSLRRASKKAEAESDNESNLDAADVPQIGDLLQVQQGEEERGAGGAVEKETEPEESRPKRARRTKEAQSSAQVASAPEEGTGPAGQSNGDEGEEPPSEEPQGDAQPPAPARTKRGKETASANAGGKGKPVQGSDAAAEEQPGEGDDETPTPADEAELGATRAMRSKARGDGATAPSAPPAALPPRPPGGRGAAGGRLGKRRGQKGETEAGKDEVAPPQAEPPQPDAVAMEEDQTAEEQATAPEPAEPTGSAGARNKPKALARSTESSAAEGDHARQAKDGDDREGTADASEPSTKEQVAAGSGSQGAEKPEQTVQEKGTKRGRKAKKGAQQKGAAESSGASDERPASNAAAAPVAPTEPAADVAMAQDADVIAEAEAMQVDEVQPAAAAVADQAEQQPASIQTVPDTEEAHDLASLGNACSGGAPADVAASGAAPEALPPVLGPIAAKRFAQGTQTDKAVLGKGRRGRPRKGVAAEQASGVLAIGTSFDASSTAGSQKQDVAGEAAKGRTGSAPESESDDMFSSSDTNPSAGQSSHASTAEAGAAGVQGAASGSGMGQLEERKASAEAPVEVVQAAGQDEEPGKDVEKPRRGRRGARGKAAQADADAKAETSSADPLSLGGGSTGTGQQGPPGLLDQPAASSAPEAVHESLAAVDPAAESLPEPRLDGHYAPAPPGTAAEPGDVEAHGKVGLTADGGHVGVANEQATGLENTESSQWGAKGAPKKGKKGRKGKKESVKEGAATESGSQSHAATSASAMDTEDTRDGLGPKAAAGDVAADGLAARAAVDAEKGSEIEGDKLPPAEEEQAAATKTATAEAEAAAQEEAAAAEEKRLVGEEEERKVEAAARGQAEEDEQKAVAERQGAAKRGAAASKAAAAAAAAEAAEAQRLEEEAEAERRAAAAKAAEEAEKAAEMERRAEARRVAEAERAARAEAKRAARERAAAERRAAKERAAAEAKALAEAKQVAAEREEAERREAQQRAEAEERAAKARAEAEAEAQAAALAAAQAAEAKRAEEEAARATREQEEREAAERRAAEEQAAEEARAAAEKQAEEESLAAKRGAAEEQAAAERRAKEQNESAEASSGPAQAASSQQVAGEDVATSGEEKARPSRTRKGGIIAMMSAMFESKQKEPLEKASQSGSSSMRTRSGRGKLLDRLIGGALSAKDQSQDEAKSGPDSDAAAPPASGTTAGTPQGKAEGKDASEGVVAMDSSLRGGRRRKLQQEAQAQAGTTADGASGSAAAAAPEPEAAATPIKPASAAAASDWREPVDPAVSGTSTARTRSRRGQGQVQQLAQSLGRSHMELPATVAGSSQKRKRGERRPGDEVMDLTRVVQGDEEQGGNGEAKGVEEDAVAWTLPPKPPPRQTLLGEMAQAMQRKKAQEAADLVAAELDSAYANAAEEEDESEGSECSGGGAAVGFLGELKQAVRRRKKQRRAAAVGSRWAPASTRRGPKAPVPENNEGPSFAQEEEEAPKSRATSGLNEIELTGKPDAGEVSEKGAEGGADRARAVSTDGVEEPEGTPAKHFAPMPGAVQPDGTPVAGTDMEEDGKEVQDDMDCSPDSEEQDAEEQVGPLGSVRALGAFGEEEVVGNRGAGAGLVEKRQEADDEEAWHDAEAGEEPEGEEDVEFHDVPEESEADGKNLGSDLRSAFQEAPAQGPLESGERGRPTLARLGGALNETPKAVAVPQESKVQPRSTLGGVLAGRQYQALVEKPVAEEARPATPGAPPASESMVDGGLKGGRGVDKHSTVEVMEGPAFVFASGATPASRSASRPSSRQKSRPSSAPRRSPRLAPPADSLASPAASLASPAASLAGETAQNTGPHKPARDGVDLRSTPRASDSRGFKDPSAKPSPAAVPSVPRRSPRLAVASGRAADSPELLLKPGPGLSDSPILPWDEPQPSTASPADGSVGSEKPAQGEEAGSAPQDADVAASFAASRPSSPPSLRDSWRASRAGGSLLPGGASAAQSLAQGAAAPSVAKPAPRPPRFATGAVTSFVPLVKKQAAAPPPASGKQPVKVAAIERAEAARREQERKDEERAQRRQEMLRRQEEAKERAMAGSSSGRAVPAAAVPASSEDAGALPSQAKGGLGPSEGMLKGVEERLAKAVTTRVRMQEERRRQVEVELKRKEEERRAREEEKAARKREREEAEKAEREQKRKKVEEAARLRKEEEERRRVEIEEKDRRHRALVEEEERRRKAEAEEKRQKHMERERDAVERKRRMEEQDRAGRSGVRMGDGKENFRYGGAGTGNGNVGSTWGSKQGTGTGSTPLVPLPGGTTPFILQAGAADRPNMGSTGRAVARDSSFGGTMDAPTYAAPCTLRFSSVANAPSDRLSMMSLTGAGHTDRLSTYSTRGSGVSQAAAPLYGDALRSSQDLGLRSSLTSQSRFGVPTTSLAWGQGDRLSGRAGEGGDALRSSFTFQPGIASGAGGRSQAGSYAIPKLRSEAGEGPRSSQTLTAGIPRGSLTGTASGAQAGAQEAGLRSSFTFQSNTADQGAPKHSGAASMTARGSALVPPRGKAGSGIPSLRAAASGLNRHGAGIPAARTAGSGRAPEVSRTMSATGAAVGGPKPMGPPSSRPALPQHYGKGGAHGRPGGAVAPGKLTLRGTGAGASSAAAGASTGASAHASKSGAAGGSLLAKTGGTSVLVPGSGGWLRAKKAAPGEGSSAAPGASTVPASGGASSAAETSGSALQHPQAGALVGKGSPTAPIVDESFNSPPLQPFRNRPGGVMPGGAGLDDPISPFVSARKGTRPGELQSYELTPYKGGGSDDEDEDEEERRRRSKPVPRWAREDLHLHLSKQKSMDPDSIFNCYIGDPMREVFGIDSTKRRQRGNSGDWSRDALTPEEELQYKKTMGFA